MFHRDRESHSGFATGMLAGALFGAGVALLLAPKAGADLRGDINQSVGSLRDAVARRYRELASRAGVTVEDLQDRVTRATEAFEVGAREFMQSVQSANRHPRPEPALPIRNDSPRG
jgi:gas vesicle protein